MPIFNNGVKGGTHYRGRWSFALIARFLCFFPILASLPLEGGENEPVLKEDGLEVVSLQLRWFHQFQFAGYYAAQEKGFYREAGLKVELREIRSENKDVVETVLNGHANYGVTQSGVLRSRLEGKPVVVLAAIFQHSSAAFFARTDAGIKYLHDIVGKRLTLGYFERNPSVLGMLHREGISLDKLMNNSIPASSYLGNFMLNKTDVITGYVTTMPYYLKSSNLPFIVFRPSNYGIDFYGDCIFTSERELQEYPERTANFLAASLRGWEYALANTEEIIDLILSQYKGDKNYLTREALRYEAKTMRELILPDLVEIGHMNPGRWKHMADTFVELGMASEDYSLDGFFYNPEKSLLEKFERMIKYSFWGIWAAVLIGLGLLYSIQRLRKLVDKRTADLVQSREALQHSEEQHRLVVNSQSEMINQILSTGELIFSNKANLDFFRIFEELPQTLTRIEGLNVFELLTNPKNREEYRRALAELTPENPIYEHVSVYILLDGSTRTISWREKALFDSKGKVSSYLGVGRDITEQKRFENVLHQSEQKLRSIFETVLDGIVTIDDQDVISSINPAASKIFGYEELEVIGQNVSILMPDPHKSRHDGYIENYIDTGVKRIIGIGREVEGLRKDGSVFPLELEVSEFFMGDTRMFTGVLRDITERKKAEDTLRESENRFHRMADSTPGLIWMSDSSGNCPWLNKGWLNYTGQTMEEALGNGWAAGIHPNDFEHCDQVYRRSIETKKEIKLEYRLRRDDGDYGWIVDFGMPRFTEEGDFEGFIGYGWDISGSKKVENELIQARDTAEAANLARSRFLSNMSHELRTPLSVILGFSDLLRGQSFGKLNEKQIDYAAKIEESGRHLLSLINDLLDLAKIDAGQIEMELKMFLPENLIDAVVSLMQTQFNKKRHVVTTYCDPEIEVISGDIRKCKQIMLNILSNALKYTPEEGRIEIRTEMFSDSAVRISVSDTGIGIPADQLDIIFDEFRQADWARDEGLGGTGIGLALTKRLVELHGGK